MSRLGTPTDDMREYYYSAPKDRVVLDTLELRHPAFVADDGVTPAAARVVNDDVEDDFLATLEADAPMNGGEQVTFKATRFDVTLPESNSPGLPSCQIGVCNIGRLLMDNIQLAVSQPEPVRLTYRQFLVDDPSAPGVVIDGLTIGRINVTPQRVTATAGFENDLNAPFPKKNYTGKEYPGLVS